MFALAVAWRPAVERKVAPFLVVVGVLWIGIVARDPIERLLTRQDLLPPEVAAQLQAAVAADPEVTVTIELETERLIFGDRCETFPIDPFSKHCLLNGVDQLGYLMDQLPAVEAFEDGR